MSREIKFRGRCVMTGDWAYGYYYPSKGRHIIRDAGDSETMVLPESVGQYTNQKDNKGIEVYTGDVYRDEFSIDDEQGIDERLYFVCVYLKSISSFVWLDVNEYNLGLHKYDKWPDDLEPPYPLDADEMDKITIIGNIYQNPKYLKIEQ